MSQISAEIIVNDFNKLKEMFTNLNEKHVWDVFSSLDFNFNKALNNLLNEQTDNKKDELENNSKDSTKKANETRKPFNVMETLRNMYNNNSQPNNSSFNYHQLD